MKAVYYEKHGPVDVLKIGNLPVPPIKEDEVLVEVAATSVNPIDRRLRAGELQEYIARVFPVVPGWDLTGRIIALGNKVSNWKVGDEIVGLAFSWSIQHGTYAQYAPISVNAIARKPKTIDFGCCASLPLISLTAWQSLHEFGNVRPGDAVLIHAGAGGLGSVAIPIARYLGAKVYTTASADKTAYCLSLGANHVIDYNTTDYENTLLEMEPGGLDMILESVSMPGDKDAAKAIRIVKDGGAVAYMNIEPPKMPEIASRGIRAKFLHHRADGLMLSELMALFENKVLPIPFIELLSIDDAAEAHARSESGRTKGKLVLEVQKLKNKLS